MSSVFKANEAASRYVRWLQRRSVAILSLSALIQAAAVYLCLYWLPLHADFASLLPQNAPAVRDLHRLERRVRTQDTVLAVVVSADPVARARAAAELAAGCRALPDDLVAQVEVDDADSRAFLSAHRHLFVPLADLEAARDALVRRIKDAKLKANPLYIDLDEEEGRKKQDADDDQLQRLRDKRREAEQRLDHSGFVSADGTAQLVVLRTPFHNTEVARGMQLRAALAELRARAMAGGGVEIGFSGAVMNALAEHDALIRGMLHSGVITALLVSLLLLLYFRSASLVVMLGLSLTVAVTASFGMAALTVGHLNAATAFLGAIIAGNGVNYGILLIARFLEERRHRLPPADALAIAIRGTLRPTIVASLGAAIAYGSLSATSFRGFADFAVIGAVGMLLCWLSAFITLPVLVMRFAANPRISDGEPIVGRLLARLFAFQRPEVLCAAAAVLAVAAGALAWRYVAADPFEYDVRNLRSRAAEAVEARRWQAVSDKAFGRGISGVTYIATDRPDQAPMVVDALRAIDAGKPPAERTIGVIHSILELVPPQQEEKRAVLAEIRHQLDDEALKSLSDDERKEIDELRPPDHIDLITPESLPAELADKLRERDGRIGYLIGVRPNENLDEWNGRDLVRFASAIRRVQLADGETLSTSGTSVIFADILSAIRGDGPFVTGLAAVGLIFMILIVIGANLRAVSVMLATTLGSLFLVGVCALLGIRVNFLDFVALPITLGLGVDYAVNVAHRHHHGNGGGAAETLRTSGSAVFVCSLTTIIGYGSLLVSDNLAIRSFGIASLIGEVCCLTTALALVPAFLSLAYRRGPEAP